MLKKIFSTICILLASGILSAWGQNNIIQITQTNGGTTTTQKDCGYKINGICSSEDIGGVSLEKISRVATDEGYFSNGITTAYLKNYNNFAVTVLMELIFDSSSKGGSLYKEEVYQVVIQSGETKEVTLRHCNCPSCYSLNGMIVRRLRN